MIATCGMAVAQQEQIKGRVLSRTTNLPIEGARVQISSNVDEHIVTTNENGLFTVSNLYPATWRVWITVEDFSDYNVPSTLRPGAVLDLGTIFMFPTITNMAIMDAGGMEMETEGGDQTQSGPSLLSGSADPFTNISNFRFSEMRFKARGYNWNLQRVYLNGLHMNDINTGNSPFFLWGGLNDLMRNQEPSMGMHPTGYAVGNVAGTNNVVTRPSQIRRGFQGNYASSGTLANRLSIAWANEIAPSWFLAVAGGVRYSPTDYFLNYTLGTFQQGVSYFLGLEKRFGFGHSLSITGFGAPLARGSTNLTTQEVFDLLQNPYYNPNIGWQNGQIRNGAVRNSHEPVITLDYTNRISSRLRIQAAANYRFGRSGVTGIDWHNAPDPRPDYWRNLPSAFTERFGNEDPIKEINAREAWLTDPNVRHINWENMYNVNYNNRETIQNATNNGVRDTVITGLRSVYAAMNRRVDQRDFSTGITVNAMPTAFLRIDGGINYRWNRTHYHLVMHDLLGGDFWVDVDQFAERAELGEEADYPREDQIQNDMNNPNRIVRVGDSYSYNYYAFTQRGSLWGIGHYDFGNIGVYFGGDIGFTSFHREGLVRKGLFPDNSYGKSESNDFLTYSLQAGMNYQVWANHYVNVNVNFVQQAPVFQDAYLSPRTRNTTVNDLKPEKIFATDLGYTIRLDGTRFRIAGFYTEIYDRSSVRTFYDDVKRTMSNFALSKISQRHMGVEFGADVYVWNGFTVKSAVAYGDYKYSSNPLLTLTEDNSDKLLSSWGGFEDERVYWKGFYVAGTPQLASNLGIEYRARQNWFGGIDLNYYDYIFVEINPRRRTDAALQNLSGTEKADMLRQERFDGGFSLNANIGQWRTIMRKYNLGIMLSINNILNNQNLKTGGFEQSRMRLDPDTNQYRAYDSRYAYMAGTSYFLNVFLRF